MLKAVFISIMQNYTRVRYGCILLLLLAILNPASVKAQDLDYSFHAKYVYHFTKYIDWPTSKKSGDFVIAVVGQSPANKTIKDFFTGKKVGNQTVVVKEMPPVADFTNINIIYLTSSSSNQLSVLVPKAQAAKALIVCEKSGLARKGADISFFIDEEKLKFELHKSTIENKGLKIAGDLLRLAVVI